MKAITVTQEIKDKNYFARNRELGSIYSGSLPNKFWVTERVIGGYPERTDLHQADGWYDVVKPTITDTEKLEALYFDEVNEIFTYPVIAKTPEEIAEDEVRELNSDVSQQAIDQRFSDGQQAYLKILAEMERKVRKGLWTKQEWVGATRFAEPFFEPVFKGNWYASKLMLASLTPSDISNIAYTVPADLQTWLISIKTKVDTYVTNNY